MAPGRSAATKAAELASGLGAIVLGAGSALVLRDGLRTQGPALLIVGVRVHGAGMSLKHRLEARGGPAVWWERLLFWGRWIGLAAVILWAGAAAIT